ncbi:VC0807 family protein [Acidimangrovimonas sediminis]|uniref:VC0807 family protein n=1 Tax=Acidimangrovimonas sediminis TaxID=2056283 RepID=UPI0018ED5238|nr:VC0807 family protein [Acidimangrovimonas sediminis]
MQTGGGQVGRGLTGDEAATGGLTGRPRPRIGRVVWTLVDLMVNMGAPYLIYSWAQPQWGEVNGLLASSLPPILWSLGEFAMRRRLDALSLMVLAGIALSLLAFVGGGSARMLQLREKLVTLAIGLAFLVSALMGRPLILSLARASMARRSGADLARFEAAVQGGALRRMMWMMSLVWGAGLVAEFCLAVVLIYAMPIDRFLIVGPVMSYATLGLLGLWTVLYRRRAVRGMRAGG